ncbi:MAG: hypothetical protein H6711_16635 [Myxococcales bacterium]|nr:hypothetical protein [Myxococcales bacterium]
MDCKRSMLVLSLIGIGEWGCGGKAIETGSATDATSVTDATSSTATASGGEAPLPGACEDCNFGEYECGGYGMWPGLRGCDLSALRPSAVTGTTPNGPLAGTRVLFATLGQDCNFKECQRVGLYVVDDDVDIAEFVAAREAGAGDVVRSLFHLKIALSEPLHALNGSGGSGYLFMPGAMYVPFGGIEVVDLVRLGSWYVSDPDDPPRLGGTLRIGDVVVAEGSFDAVYCDVFDDFGACS